MINKRRDNKYDVNILITGDRGDGKSQVAWKIMRKLIGKRKWLKKAKIYQVYKRKDIIDLLKTQKKGYMWSDETIEGGFNRDFANKDQKELVKIITKYRSHYNISIYTLPIFKTLDPALKDLIFCHIHVYERGSAAVFLKPKGYVYSTDLWRTKECADIERKWEARRQKDPNYDLPYHDLPTFETYLHVGDAIPEDEEELYESIKDEKKGNGDNDEEQVLTPFEKIYQKVKNEEITREGLQQFCVIEDMDYNQLCRKINLELKKEEIFDKTLFSYIKKSNRKNAEPDVVYVEKNDVPMF